MDNDVLYADGRVKVTYLHSPEPGREEKVTSTEDHELWIKGRSDEWMRYIIPRGVLRELSEGSGRGESLQDLASKLNSINHFILEELGREGIDLTSVQRAIVGARQTEEENFRKYLEEQGKLD